MLDGRAENALMVEEVGVLDDGDRLLESITRRGPGEYASRLRILPGHPFFFEHPQDHLPGMYLLEASRQLGVCATNRHMRSDGVSPPVERSPEPVDIRATEFAVKFDRFAEMDAAIDAEATISGDPGSGIHRIEFGGTQAGHSLCSAKSAWSTTIVDPSGAPRATDDLRLAVSLATPVPVTRQHVHKQREENVFLDWIADHPADPARCLAGVRLFADHPYFRPGPGGVVGTLYLTECVRQLAEALSHVVLGVPLGHAFVIRSMEVGETWPATTAEAIHLEAVRLEHSDRPESTRLRYGFTAQQGGRRILSGECTWLVFPPAVYRQIRRAA